MSNKNLFKLNTKFLPAGDQPQAIDKLIAGLEAKKKDQVFTMIILGPLLFILILYSVNKLKYTLGNTIAPIAAPLLFVNAFILPIMLLISISSSLERSSKPGNKPFVSFVPANSSNASCNIFFLSLLVSLICLQYI